MKYIVAGAGAFAGGQSTVLAGLLSQETASIAYTGELLPAGTASYGSELIVNGTFDSSTSWMTQTVDASNYSEVVASKGHIVSNGTLVALNQICLVSGKYYIATITVTSITGSMAIQIGADVTVISTTGTFTFIGLANQATFIIKRNTSCDAYFDNVSVKEVLINPNTRYLKNSGKDKTPALVESGQGKFFNGTSQYINTGIIPNQTEGTLVTRFTYVTGQVSRCIIGNTEISIWVNASGKIEGLFGDAVITSTDVLVNGRSYHVELPYIGLDASIKVDNIAKASGTALSFTPMLPLFIGARNNSGTADRYFNNVIDETYYYDVALPDSAIQALYLYPEKVKSYDGAIVPDIGSEANCKLFLPLCENSGSNVVNVAVAKQPLISPTPNTAVNGTGNTNVFNDIDTFAINLITATSVSYFPLCSVYESFVAGTQYYINVEVYCISGSCKIGNLEFGNFDGSTAASTGINVVLTAGQSYKNSFIGYARVDGKNNLTFDGLNYPVGSFTVKYTKHRITAYPLVNYTTAMHTSAAKLSYGAQCIAWKRDSLGVLLGMSGSMSYDANVSVKPVFTSWVPKYDEDWCCEVIQYNDGVGVELNGVNATTRFSIGMNGIYAYIYATGVFKSVAVDTGWHHLFVRYTASTKTFVLTLNGVAQAPIVSSSFTSDPLYSFCIGAERTGASTSGFYLGNRVILKQYNAIQSTKITEAKSWANAQKTIAKLGA